MRGTTDLYNDKRSHRAQRNLSPLPPSITHKIYLPSPLTLPPVRGVREQRNIVYGIRRKLLESVEPSAILGYDTIFWS